MSLPIEIVWLTEERTYGVLINRGAFYSTVKYTRNGTDYEVLVENTDYEIWSEHSIDYESE